MKRPVRKPKPRRRPTTHLIGWKEYIDFTDWGIEHVKAKIDTGARTSAVHVEEYALCEKAPFGTMIELHLALDRHRPGALTVVNVPVLRMIRVTNSGGQREIRPLIATTMRLGPVRKHVLLTVTNRSSMLFRVLLGRKALEGDFVVDVRKKYLMRDAGRGTGNSERHKRG